MNDGANRLALLSLPGVATRLLQLAWMVFFVCFFPWMVVAALRPLLHDELHLTNAQVANNMAALLITVSVVSIGGRIRSRYGVRRD
jgi:nitrate/nitrite transporter NarK